MKNEVKFTTYKDGSIKVSVSDSLYKEEFDKIKVLYDLSDIDLNRKVFKSDALNFVLICAVQGWIDGFDCEAKNNYDLVLERDGEKSVFHVVDGQSYYDDPDLKDEGLQEDIKEDMVESSTDID